MSLLIIRHRVRIGGMENVTCQLCSQLYTDPLMLPCLHSFCKSCVIKTVEAQDTITYPSCNEASKMVSPPSLVIFA